MMQKLRCIDVRCKRYCEIKFASALIDLDLNIRHLEANIVRSLLRSCNNCIACNAIIIYINNNVITSYYKIHLEFLITAKIV